MKLKITALSKLYRKDGYETQALSDVTVMFEEGDQFMVVGESGSGKSTLLNILGLLDRDYSGSYKIDGKEIRSLSKSEQARMRNEVFGYIFQDYVLLESESIYNNVRIPLLYSRHRKQEHRELIEDSLEKVGLKDILNKRVQYLSGGQRQRVAIARALVNKPSVILADEPTGALDAKTRHEVLEIIYQSLDPTKIMIFVTHDLKNNQRGDQKLMHLEQGRIVPHAEFKLEKPGNRMPVHPLAAGK